MFCVVILWRLHLFSGSCWNKRTGGTTGRKGNKGNSCMHTHVHTQMYFLTYIRVYKQVVFIIFYREPQVLLAPQVKQALWVPRECQENLEQKVLEGSQDQWLVNSATSTCLRSNVWGPTPTKSLFVSGWARLSWPFRTERTTRTYRKLAVPSCFHLRVSSVYSEFSSTTSSLK